MQHHCQHPLLRNITILGMAAVITGGFLGFVVPDVGAADASLVTIYVDGDKQAMTTDADTVREILDRTGVEVGGSDVVEPGLDAEITGQTFNINVYRSHPVVITDPDKEEVYRTETAHQSPRLIAEEAEAVTVYEEDELEMELVTNFVTSDFVGHKVIIDRAVPVNVELANRETVMRTHASTVEGMFQEKDVNIGRNDIVKPGLDAPIKKGMEVSLTRVGYKTITKEEPIAPPTKKVFNNDRPLEYEKVEEQGEPGVALVTYKVEYRNGEVVSRSRVRRVVDSEPEPQVVVVGNKTSFKNDTEKLLRTLRNCETGGDYKDVHEAGVDGNGNQIVYYGAYHFLKSTWDSLGTGYEYPHKAPPGVQDQAVLDNVRRSAGGFHSQHPGCSEIHNLPKFP